MRYELKSIGLWPLVKVSFFFNLVVGFILGLFYAFFLSIIVSGITNIPIFPEIQLSDLDVPIGLLFIIIPIITAFAAAFFHTLLFGFLALIYNLFVKLLGGLEFELNPITLTTTVPSPSQPITAYTIVPPPPPSYTPPPSPPLPHMPPPEPPHVAEPRDDNRDRME